MTSSRYDYDVVSFGETMLRLSPRPGERLETAEALHPYVAGTESNTLCCLARLGLHCCWLSALPMNPAGRRVYSQVTSHGVDTSHITWANADSRLGLFYAEESAEPLGTQVFYDRTDSAVARISPQDIPYKVIQRARLLHLTGITPALSPQAHEVFMVLLRKASDAGVEISFDVNYRAKLWSASEAADVLADACGLANYLFCTCEDAEDLWGITGNPESVLRQLAARFGEWKTIAITLGRDGSAHLVRGKFEHAAAVPSTGSYRFGSGDAFAAGYLYARLSNSDAPSRDALVYGNAAAALKRAIPGDIAAINPEELARIVSPESVRFR